MDNRSMIVNQMHLSFLDQLVKDSRPFESCAILLGKCDKGQYFVQEIIPTQNEESSEIRFTIDDNRLFEIYKLADDKNMSVIGIFHSHPSLPFPSETDKVYMKINPVPWIIKSTTTNEMRCFISEDQKNGNENNMISEMEIIVRD